ncbi:MAG: hypothetical protein QM783_09540 [Phycisphaerales bacterium]
MGPGGQQKATASGGRRSSGRPRFKNLWIGAIAVTAGLWMGIDTLSKMIGGRPMNWMNRVSASSTFALRPGETLWWLGGAIAIAVSALMLGYGLFVLCRGRTTGVQSPEE